MEPGRYFIEKIGPRPDLSRDGGGSAEPRDACMTEGYKCERNSERSSTKEENARAGASARERPGCLVFTSSLIASGVPEFRQAQSSNSPRFTGKSQARQTRCPARRGVNPTFLCG